MVLGIKIELKRKKVIRELHPTGEESSESWVVGLTGARSRNPKELAQREREREDSASLSKNGRKITRADCCF